MNWWDTHRVLRRGSRGPDVEVLQRALKQDPHASTRPLARGIFDEAMENEVKEFQMRNYLVEDGKVGPITHSILLGGNYEYAISKPPIVTQPLSTCWAAALESVLHSSWQHGRPRLTVGQLVQQYRKFLMPQLDITVPGWKQIAIILRLRVQEIRTQDLRLEQIVWLLRESRMHLVMVHDMTGAVRHTVVIYGVRIRAGAPDFLVMDPLHGDHRTLGADILRQKGKQLFLSGPVEVKQLPRR